MKELQGMTRFLTFLQKNIGAFITPRISKGKKNRTNFTKRYKMGKEDKEIVKKIQGHEPKRRNRFVVSFTDPWDVIPSYVVKAVELPKYFEGEWQSFIEVKLYDPIEPSVSSLILQILEKQKTIARPEGDLILMKIKLLGPEGDEVSEWKIAGKFVNFDFGKLDWSKDEVMEINALFQVHEVVKDNI